MSEVGMRPTTRYMKSYFKNKEIVGAEIGVFKGWNAERMLSMLNIKKLSLIDVWITPDYLKEQYNLEKFYDNICTKYKDDKRIEIIREYSNKAYKLFEPESLDFVYIDGDHSYKGCLEDVVLYYNLVKKGGIICGHDYYCCNGVKEAVHELAGVQKLFSKLRHTKAIGKYDRVAYGEWLIIK